MKTIATTFIILAFVADIALLILGLWTRDLHAVSEGAGNILTSALIYKVFVVPMKN